MNLEFFVDTYRPYISGVITAVDITSSKLRGRGHRVTINAPAYPNHDGEKEQYVRRIRSLPFPGYEGLRIAAPVPFKQTPKEPIDLVHAHSPFPMGLAGLRLAHDRRVPIVYTCHSLYPDYSEYIPWASSTLRKVLEAHLQYFCNRCDAVIAPSEHVRDKLREWGVTQPMYITPTGIELRSFQAQDSEEAREWITKRHSLAEGQFLLLFVGRLAQEKNIEHALAELARVRELAAGIEERNMHLLLVGTGPHEQALGQITQELGLGSSVTFVGTVERDKVIQYYRGADVFVFPSLSETQGIVLIEALAGGLPVVALSAPTTREVVRDGVEGILVSAARGDLAAALQQLRANSELRKQLSSGALQRANDFAASSMVTQLEAVYKEVAANYTPPRTLADALLPSSRKRRLKNNGV